MSEEAEINARAEAIIMEKKKKEVKHCPILTIGQGQFAPCTKNCAWYLESRNKCAIALIGKLVYELELFHPH
jgi:hypothetical protein